MVASAFSQMLTLPDKTSGFLNDAMNIITGGKFDETYQVS